MKQNDSRTTEARRPIKRIPALLLCAAAINSSGCSSTSDESGDGQQGALSGGQPSSNSSTAVQSGPAGLNPAMAMPGAMGSASMGGTDTAGTGDVNGSANGANATGASGAGASGASGAGASGASGAEDSGASGVGASGAVASGSSNAGDSGTGDSGTGDSSAGASAPPGAGGSPGSEDSATSMDDPDSDDGAGGGANGDLGGEEAGPACPKPEGEICHEFLVNDNSRHQILYVNEFDPTSNWSQATQDTNGGNSPRQLEIVDNAMASQGKAVMVSVNSGYEEYDLVTHERLARVDLGGIGVRGAQRLPDGNTVLGIGDAALRVVSPDGSTVGTECNLPGTGDETLRILTRDADTGLIYYGRGLDIFAVNMDCEQQWTARFPDSGSKAYRVMAHPDGGAWATTGDPSTILLYDASGQVVSELGGRDAFPGIVDFFSGFDIAESGNIVVANWWGHLESPPQDGPHVIELNAANEMVWRWGTQAEATNVTNVLLIR